MVVRSAFFGSSLRFRLFTAIKYLTYSLLAVNVWLFFEEELSALEHTFRDGFALSQLVQVFSATIDTAAWLVLLLLFELETSLLDDRYIRGAVRWSLHGVRGICYVGVVYAFTGYYAELVTLYQVEPVSLAAACAELGQSGSLLQGLDEYVPLSPSACEALSPDTVRLTGFSILAEPGVLQSARLLAWTDVVNAAAWIMVVILLEIEVRMQLSGELTDRVLAVNKLGKGIVYSVLFAAAIYWGFAGDFLDFWDAALWLFAFIFIELNVFDWQYETRHVPEAA
jgi:multisubunit Na+/H+ antiporter MnhF subunit